MQPKKIGWFPVLLLVAILLMAILAGTGDEESPAGTLRQQGGEYTTANEQWKLVQFDNLAIEVDGELYDRGVFQNQTTGESVVAQCITMDIPDPSVGDVYTRQGDMFNPVSGGAQTFQTFQVITTPTAQPTDTSVPTQIPTSTVVPTRTPIPTFKGKVEYYSHLALGWAMIALVFVALIGGWILLNILLNKLGNR